MIITTTKQPQSVPPQVYCCLSVASAHALHASSDLGIHSVVLHNCSHGHFITVEEVKSFG